MRNFILAGVAVFAILIPSKAQAACDDRFINTCSTRSWHWAPNHHQSEFRDPHRIKRVVHRKLVKAIHRGHEIATAAIKSIHAGGLTTVCAESHCGTVAANAADKFLGLFKDLVALGYNIGHPGCYSPTGHMRNSLHHWGGACDLFNQVARNRTALKQPPPSVQIEVASKHGLTSGCAWRNPDCGHFDLSGIGRAYAHVRHVRHVRHYRFRAV